MHKRFSRIKFSTHHGQNALLQEVQSKQHHKQLKVRQEYLRVFENWIYLYENCLGVFYLLNGN